MHIFSVNALPYSEDPLIIITYSLLRLKIHCSEKNCRKCKAYNLHQLERIMPQDGFEILFHGLKMSREET